MVAFCSALQMGDARAISVQFQCHLVKPLWLQYELFATAFILHMRSSLIVSKGSSVLNSCH